MGYTKTKYLAIILIYMELTSKLILIQDYVKVFGLLEMRKLKSLYL